MTTLYESPARATAGIPVKSRERTGAGFFTEFLAANTAPSAPIPTGKLRFGDVEATIGGLRHGAGFFSMSTADCLGCLRDTSTRSLGQRRSRISPSAIPIQPPGDPVKAARAIANAVRAEKLRWISRAIPATPL